MYSGFVRFKPYRLILPLVLCIDDSRLPVKTLADKDRFVPCRVIVVRPGSCETEYIAAPESAEARAGYSGWQGSSIPVWAHRISLLLIFAVVLYQVGDDRACLMTLVHDLHDATSAEAYCTLGGGGGAVVPPRVARALAESESYLEGWAGALFGGVGKKGAPPVPVPLGRQKEGVEEGVKKGLLKLLLEVYMMDGYVGSRWLFRA